jgi:D-alanyl-D-alanine carboxypeptidase (penicillin-binding protein 5/6)
LPVCSYRLSSAFALYVRWVPSIHPTLRRSAVTLCAATLTGGTLFTAAASFALAEASQPVPPEHMSTTGGNLLGKPGTQVHLAPGVPKLPMITARSWIVSDADTGQVLAAHNAHWRLAPASTLKMLFADTLISKFPKDEVHTVQATDLAGIGDGSSMVGIKPNLPYSVADLWRGVFLRSGNDAVHVLAAMNGGVGKTVAEMQQRAGDLQAYDTHVVSPDGYDMPGELSSAYDLTLFARAGMQNADFREYCSTANASFPGAYKNGTKDRVSFAIQNTDRLLSGVYGMRRYPGIAGVKNGYTTHAGNTYTGFAQRDGKKLLVTVMHPRAGNDQVYKEATALFDWGFAADEKVQPVGELVQPKNPQVRASLASGANGKGNPGGTSSALTPTGDAGQSTLALVAGAGAVLLAVLGAAVLAVRKQWPAAAALAHRVGAMTRRTPRQPAPKP